MVWSNRALTGLTLVILGLHTPISNVSAADPVSGPGWAIIDLSVTDDRGSVLIDAFTNGPAMLFGVLFTPEGEFVGMVIRDLNGAGTSVDIAAGSDREVRTIASHEQSVIGARTGGSLGGSFPAGNYVNVVAAVGAIETWSWSLWQGAGDAQEWRRGTTTGSLTALSDGHAQARISSKGWAAETYSDRATSFNITHSLLGVFDREVDPHFGGTTLTGPSGTWTCECAIGQADEAGAGAYTLRSSRTSARLGDPLLAGWIDVPLAEKFASTG